MAHDPLAALPNVSGSANTLMVRWPVAADVGTNLLQYVIRYVVPGQESAQAVPALEVFLAFVDAVDKMDPIVHCQHWHQRIEGNIRPGVSPKDF